jgi:hypothetical protein
MFNTTKTYTVGTQVRLDKIFVNGLPKNGFVNKGRCAIGGTFMEIMNKSRCTLIAVPNISILLNKQDQHPEIDVVYGNVSYQDVIDILKKNVAGQKIMTTPEGMRKIIKAAYEIGRLDEMYSQWFLLLDEAHTFITENYRDDILAPFEYFWKFDNKCIISATPYIFTDERFKTLDYHAIMFTDKLGVVSLINATSVVGSLEFLIKHRDEFPGNIHIFYNSVTEIKQAIIRSGLLECNVYCADDDRKKNMAKLGELIKHFVSKPEEGLYKKVNFYTSKYFEGWDLYDEQATVVLVTDVHKSHTIVGVSTKGKQAIGRLRNPPYQIIHITNHKHLKVMKPLEAFRNDYLFAANYGIKQHNDKVGDFRRQGIDIPEDESLLRYADVKNLTHIATLNYMKLDQQIHEAASNEIYNHIDYIEQDWKDAYFTVERDYSDETSQTPTAVKRKSKAEQLKEDYLKLMHSKANQQVGIVFGFGSSLEERIKESNPTAYLAAQHLDKDTMDELKYNVKKVSAEIVYKENTLAEVKLLKLLEQMFKVGDRPTNKFIKDKLQEFYNRLNIRENGKIRVASALQLGERGRFEIDPGKNKDGEHCMIIKRAQFSLRMAA